MDVIRSSEPEWGWNDDTTINPPISDEALATLESDLGFPLHPQWVDFLKLSNGLHLYFQEYVKGGRGGRKKEGRGKEEGRTREEGGKEEGKKR